jgi:hypothetical protein
MAWLFDAATDKVLVGSGWTGSAFTICLWVKRSAAASNSHGNNPWRAWSNAAGGGSTIAGMDVQGSSRTTVVAYDSAFTQTVGGDIRSDAGWHPVAIVVNGTAGALFYSTANDATSLTKVTATRATGATAGSFTLSDAAPDWFDGAIANVKLFGAALSDAEVAAELATYAQVRSTNLLFRATLATSSNTPETGTTMTAGGTAVTVVSGPSALDPVTGTAAGAVRTGFLSGSLAGTVHAVGALAGTAPHPVAAALVGSNRGAVAGTVPSSRGALVGLVPDVGGLAGVTPLAVGALAGRVVDVGALAAVPPRVVSTLAGTHPAVGSVAATLRLPVSTLREGERFPPGAWRTGAPVVTAGWGTRGEQVALTADWRAGDPTEAA